MRKNTKKAVCIFFAVLLLACSFPISAFAVDPISATAIANGFAQAITAYGASHGVSMTFDGIDSGNTAQIGQSVHDLWARFRAGQQTADDYDTIAAAVFPGLYNKVIKAGGTAVVGMSIAQQYMPDIDEFWNWLLSGPAEMVKVDNAYQWNVDSQTGEIVSPVVFSVTVPPEVPYATSASADSVLIYTSLASSNDHLSVYTSQNDYPVYTFCIPNGYQYRAVIVSTSTVNCSMNLYRVSNNSFVSGHVLSTTNLDSTTNLYYRIETSWSASSSSSNLTVPYYDTLADGLAAVQSDYPSIRIAPYIGDAVAQPVPIPDVNDPDYGPLPWAGDLDLPWNDTLFGDGTGTLTDAQKEAISGALDQSIEDDGTLVLVGDDVIDNPGTDTDDPPSSDPDDYGVIGLENVFPFCIPFDIYNFLSALAAAPTAPHFTATLQLPEAVGGTQTIELDFDNPTFNQLAQLLRLLELLAFIVGLALLTRSMFIRG